MNQSLFRPRLNPHHAIRNALFVVAGTLMTSYASIAQKATVRDGIIYRDGERYARVQTSGTSSYPSFSFKTLQGEEFMMMHYDDGGRDYRVVFFPGEEQTRLPRRYGSLPVMAQEVVDNNLVKDGSLSPAGVKRFMLAHPSPGTGSNPAVRRRGDDSRDADERGTMTGADKIERDFEQAADEVSDAILGIGRAVERAFEKDSARRAERRLHGEEDSDGIGIFRDHGASVTATEAELRQGGVPIGNYEIGATKSGDRAYTFYAPSGKLIAEATVQTSSAKTAKLTTHDNHTATIFLQSQSPREVAAEIGAWLVKRRYL